MLLALYLRNLFQSWGAEPLCCIWLHGTLHEALCAEAGFMEWSHTKARRPEAGLLQNLGSYLRGCLFAPAGTL